MNRFLMSAVVAILAFSLPACQRETEAPPKPFSLTEEAMGHYCGMNVLEHAGPKGQIILARYDQPIWFSSVRDTIAFTMLPEEAKDIRGIFVSDMGRAPNWEAPGADNWIEASRAFFVIESRVKGGMGADEAVPFSTEAAAKTFAHDNGGRVVTLAQIPGTYILGNGSTPDMPPPATEQEGM